MHEESESFFSAAGRRCDCEGPASLLSRWLHRISIAQVVTDECNTDHIDPTCHRSGETCHLVHQSEDSYVKIELGQTCYAWQTAS